ncbi:MAG TPA: hypothetical protein PK521_11910 [Bacteroidales bacterium]|mgnify:CR=1 FL=1|nr:hypothetical protein [Bacteroidales bacterium]HQM70003.1 hypothetical protein [Bacteroidales bacterium]
MNAAEIKLDLFRKIDNLNEPELGKIYKKFLALLNAVPPYKLSREEKAAIEAALENGLTYTHDEVKEESRRKYPKLRFK